MKYRLHPVARRELQEAAQHYREQGSSVAPSAFLGEFRHSIELLLRYPRLGGVWLHGRRRLLMRRFPYAIIYTIEDDEILVLAVPHHSREPGYWRDRE